MKYWRALSFKQPWAHAVLHFGKDIDNRPRLIRFTGDFLIHVSASETENSGISRFSGYVRR